MEKTLTESLLNTQFYADLVVNGGSYAVKIIIALVIYLVGKRIARGITNIVITAMERGEVDDELTIFLNSLIYWVLLAVVIIAALGQLGVQTASFIAMLGAAGLAIGLALQGSLSNFAAGILILLLRPFNVDDWVEVAGESGKVKRIHIFTTELLSGDNKCIIIPNSQVLASTIINYSSTGHRRVDLVFCVAYEADIDQVRAIIRKVIDADTRILSDRETQITVAQLADCSVNFNVRPWVKTGDYSSVRSDLMENMKKAFDVNGITIPYPQMDVRLQQSES